MLLRKIFKKNTNKIISFLIFLILSLIIIIFLLYISFQQKIKQANVPYYDKVLYSHLLKDSSVMTGSIIFVGDSFIQSLNESMIFTPSVNYGISGDTTEGVLGRLSKYGSLNKASAVVFLVGLNDIINGQEERLSFENMEAVILSLGNIPVVLNGLIPVEEKLASKPGIDNKIKAYNNGLQKICALNEKCVFVDNYDHFVDENENPIAEYYINDGIHLNGSGYGILINNMKAALGI